MMKMRKNTLKVYYKGNLNQELDEAIEKILSKFGYHRWASGMSCENVRDLAFGKTGVGE
jgi:hypothetical protein